MGGYAGNQLSGWWEIKEEGGEEKKKIMSKCVTSEHWCEIWNLIHEVVDYYELRLKRGAAVGWKAGARRHRP